MKTSIIIPNYNGKHLLAECIASIKKYTLSSYEIIVVDNGSEDESLAFCRQEQIPFVSLPENKGFPTACNLGMQLATGDTILLLNNDVLAAPYWLEHMLACLHEHEEVGMVGPMSNYVSGEQQISFPYTNVEDAAKKLKRECKGKRVEVNRLVGFCLLIKREMMQQIGLLDEQFSPGHFDDDDYSYRARQAGYKLLIAADAFVFHHGSSSFSQLGAEQVNELIARNRQLFINKWGVDPHTLI